MREAFRFAALRGLRTFIQALAGVAGSVPIVNTFTDARVAGIAALAGVVGAGLAGVAAFLQNFAEALEDLEV
jgi:hypothetical protein